VLQLSYAATLPAKCTRQRHLIAQSWRLPFKEFFLKTANFLLDFDRHQS